MADAVTTTTSKHYSNGVEIITINMVCATAAAAFTSSVLRDTGKRVHSITVTPGSTGPTDNSDLAITDGLTTVDMVATNGANIVDNATVSNILPDTVANIIVGSLTVAVSNNSVNNAETTITIVLREDF